MSAEIYKLIRVTGTDAGEFLQGQLTQDIALVDRHGCLPAAWCNPKGRVITILRVLKFDGGYGLILPAGLAEDVRKRLLVYRLRADVGIEVADWDVRLIKEQDDFERLADSGLRPPQKINACRTGHGLVAVNLGFGDPIIELTGQAADLDRAGFRDTAPAEDLLAAKIRAGIPEITEGNSEKFTPHMLNLDLLGAISFDKGCYTGQEIVARTQNLGSSKRRLKRYHTHSTLAAGDKLCDGDAEVGEVVNVVGGDLLAVTRIDVQDKTLSADGIEVSPVPVT